jgi:hypothetical protein
MTCNLLSASAFGLLRSGLRAGSLVRPTVSNAVTIAAVIVLVILLVVSFVVTNSHLANTIVFVGGAAVVIVARAVRGRSKR